MQRNSVLALCLFAAILLAACTAGGSPANQSTPAPASTAASTAGAPAPTSVAPIAENAATAATSQPVAVTFAAETAETPIYEPLIEKFEQENPDIEVRLVPLDPFLQSAPPSDPNLWLLTLLKSADTVATGYVDVAARRGWVRDLRPFIDADPSFDRADFYPGVLDAVNRGTATYLLPRSLDVPLLSYNKALWLAAGLPPPGAEWRWPDLIAAAEQLTRKRGSDVTVHGLVAWNTSLIVMNGELAAAGVDLAATPLDQLHLDDPAFEAALDRAVALTKSGVLFIGNSPFDDRQAILDQKVAMWPAETPFFRNPDTRLPFESGSVVFPTLPLSMEGYYISSGARAPEAAWRWIAFLSKQPITYKLGDSNVDTQIPVRPSIIEKSGFWKQFDPDTAARLRALFTRPAWSLSAERDERVQDLLFDALDAVMQGTTSAKRALRDAQQSLERIALQPTATPTSGGIVVATPLPAAPEGAVTIHFGAPAFSLGPIRQLATSFTKDNPQIVVDFRDTSGGAASLGAIAATTDCFISFGPPSAADIPHLRDLQPLIDADPTFQLSDYPRLLLGSFRSGDALYGLPDEVYFQVLHYNPAAFDAAGLAYPTNAWTFDDLLHAATQLTHGSGPNKQYGFAVLDDPNGDPTQNVLFFLDRLGAPLTKGSGDTLQPNFTDPAVVAAIRSYLQLLRTTSPHTHLYGYRRDVPADDSAGRIARRQVGMWAFYGTKLVGQNLPFHTAIAPPPLGEKPIATNAFHLRWLAISARTTQPDACWAWLKFMTNHLTGLGWGVPARTSMATSEAFAKQAPAGATEVYRAYRKAMEDTRDTVSSSAGLSQSPNDYYWLFQAIDRALGGQDLERELATAQTLTEHYLACVRGGTPGGVCATQVDPDYQGTPSAGL